MAINNAMTAAATIEGVRVRSHEDKAGARVKIMTAPITSEPNRPHFDAYVTSQQWKVAPVPEHTLLAPSKRK